VTFDAATFAMSKAGLELDAGNSRLSFKVTPDQINNVSTQNWQLHLHLLMRDPRSGQRNLRQDVYLWDPAVMTNGRSVDCSRCGDVTTLLMSLVRLVRESRELPPASPSLPSIGATGAGPIPARSPEADAEAYRVARCGELKRSPQLVPRQTRERELRELKCDALPN
jgi:hypothetical protein